MRRKHITMDLSCVSTSHVVILISVLLFEWVTAAPEFFVVPYSNETLSGSHAVICRTLCNRNHSTLFPAWILSDAENTLAKAAIVASGATAILGAAVQSGSAFYWKEGASNKVSSMFCVDGSQMYCNPNITNSSGGSTLIMNASGWSTISATANATYCLCRRVATETVTLMSSLTQISSLSVYTDTLSRSFSQLSSSRPFSQSMSDSTPLSSTLSHSYSMPISSTATKLLSLSSSSSLSHSISYSVPISSTTTTSMSQTATTHEYSRIRSSTRSISTSLSFISQSPTEANSSTLSPPSPSQTILSLSISTLSLPSPANGSLSTSTNTTISNTVLTTSELPDSSSSSFSKTLLTSRNKTNAHSNTTSLSATTASQTNNLCVNFTRASIIFFDATTSFAATPQVANEHVRDDLSSCYGDNTSACLFPTSLASSELQQNTSWSASVIVLNRNATLQSDNATTTTNQPIQLVVGFSASSMPTTPTITVNSPTSGVNVSWVANNSDSALSTSAIPGGIFGFVSVITSENQTNNTVLVVTLHVSSLCFHFETNLTIALLMTTPYEAVVAARDTVPASTQATTTSAAAASAVLGGDVTAAATLVLLSLISCSKLAPNPGAGAYVMSVFYDEGPVAMVFGNIGLVVVAVALHYMVVTIFLKARHGFLSKPDAYATLRYPAISIRVSDFLLAGTTFAAFLSFWSADDGAIVAGVVGVISAFSVVVGMQWYYYRTVKPLCEFTLYPIEHEIGFQLERVLLFPRGAWDGPCGVRHRFLPLMGSYIPSREFTRTLLFCPSLAMAVLSATASNDVGCGSGPWIVGVAHILTAIMVAGLLRPFRVPSDSLLAPVGMVLVGVACILKTFDDTALSNASDSVTTAIAGIQMLRTVVGLWVRYREDQLRDVLLSLQPDSNHLCSNHLWQHHVTDCRRDVGLLQIASSPPMEKEMFVMEHEDMSDDDSFSLDPSEDVPSTCHQEERLVAPGDAAIMIDSDKIDNPLDSPALAAEVYDQL